jgi:hypothetical protein
LPKLCVRQRFANEYNAIATRPLLHKEMAMSSSEEIIIRIEELEKLSEKIRKESDEMVKQIGHLKADIAKREAAKKSPPATQ